MMQIKTSPATRRKAPAALIVMIAGALALAACSEDAPRETAEQQARAVTVVPVAARSITGSVAASGPLVPREEAAVSAEIAGFRVARVLVEPGAYVRKGQTLAVLDGALLQSQLQQQEAALAQAEVQAEQAESQAARVEGLVDQGVLSNEQIEQRQFQARTARAQVRAQAAGLADLRARQARLSVSAPVSGLVLSRNVRPGDQSGAGTQPWFVIARDGQIELRADVSEADLARIRQGQSVQVTLQNGETVLGKVRLVSPQVNAQTQLGTVWISLPSRPSIRAGGFASADFQGGGDASLTVPETAVRYDGDGASVMVVGDDNRVKRVAVSTGARGGGLVELVRGPPAGSLVVESAGSFLLENDLVRPVRKTAEGAAAAPAPKTEPAK
ncbi:efflux RND transporter periplasmic adaptor subunit [Phenylobacterium sp.]|jgi:HlyD family secretion protein|uniref:efflux RND transporter periplasmic adaptor subunit n=1 Tax=Phenylobacterium sp. TaxID=1871053 RepID=UPI0025ECAC37|nr:efflux RND transporter periplasmic adaptor subunit [Phenylobacterium sp.]|tara:strand:- start:6145 stop:7302 length:1158 start_codon:yes stop_codon:yes gene_type:complete